jgi:hypothetical protein
MPDALQPDMTKPLTAISASSSSSLSGYPYLPSAVLLLDICLLIAFTTADLVSGLYMLGLTALCIPIGLILHKRRKEGVSAATP